MFKKIFSIFGQIALSAFIMITFMTLAFIVSIESYNIGQDVESKKTKVQTIAILDLKSENNDLKTQIITLDGNNYTLRILTQTQQEEIDNLKTTITSLNGSLTSLRNEKEATDEVVSQLQADVDYLNNYVAELEEQLSSSDLLVVYLPDEMSSLKQISTLKLNNDLVLLSGTNSTNGLWAYSISNNTFEKVTNIGGTYTKLEVLSEDVSLIYSSYFGTFISYNNKTLNFTVLDSEGKEFCWLCHVDTSRNICILNIDSNKIYEFNYVTEEFTKYEQNIPIRNLLYVNENYAYFSGHVYTDCISKLNLDERTIETFSGGYFCNFYKATENLIFARGNSGINASNYGLYVFDCTTDTITRLTTINPIYGDFIVMNNELYCCSKGYVHKINLETLEITSLECSFVTVSSSYFVMNTYYPLENGFLISSENTSSSNYGLYYIPYDLSSKSTILDKGFKFRFFEVDNTLYITSGASSLKGIYTLNTTNMTSTQVYDQGCAFNVAYDLGNSILFGSTEKTIDSNIYAIHYNKTTNEFTRLCQYHIVNKIYEDDNYYVYLFYNGIYKFSKIDGSFSLITNIARLYEIGNLENGSVLLKCDNGAYNGVTFILDITTYEFKSYSVEIES